MSFPWISTKPKDRISMSKWGTRVIWSKSWTATPHATNHMTDKLINWAHRRLYIEGKKITQLQIATASLWSWPAIVSKIVAEATSTQYLGTSGCPMHSADSITSPHTLRSGTNSCELERWNRDTLTGTTFWMPNQCLSFKTLRVRGTDGLP